MDRTEGEERKGGENTWATVRAMRRTEQFLFSSEITSKNMY